MDKTAVYVSNLLEQSHYVANELMVAWLCVQHSKNHRDEGSYVTNNICSISMENLNDRSGLIPMDYIYFNSDYLTIWEFIPCQLHLICFQPLDLK